VPAPNLIAPRWSDFALSPMLLQSGFCRLSTRAANTRRFCVRWPVTHPVKLGFEVAQGGEDTQVEAPRISKIKLRLTGSHRNTFGSPVH
jgi:hypothetical protein